jgi:hypothetical protein
MMSQTPEQESNTHHCENVESYLNSFLRYNHQFHTEFNIMYTHCI